MKRSAKIAIISGIAIVVIISALAVTVHLRQSTIEGTEKGNEPISQKIKEVTNTLTNQNVTENKTVKSESGESAVQRASEGK
jgi:outer membrane lipoprotein-sorting protein